MGYITVGKGLNIPNVPFLTPSLTLFLVYYYIIEFDVHALATYDFFLTRIDHTAVISDILKK